jgi:nuclear pore complex protein Nup155
MCSSRLREVCPGLYRAEDAASSKAHELLLAAAQTAKAADRERMVAEAVAIGKQIAGSLRLDVSLHSFSNHCQRSLLSIV